MSIQAIMLNLHITTESYSVLLRRLQTLLYQLHLLVDIPQDGNDLQTYAQNFSENCLIPYGIIGAHRILTLIKFILASVGFKPQVRGTITFQWTTRT